MKAYIGGGEVLSALFLFNYFSTLQLIEGINMGGKVVKKLEPTMRLAFGPKKLPN